MNEHIDYDIKFSHKNIKGVIDWVSANEVKLFDTVIKMNNVSVISVPDSINVTQLLNTLKNAIRYLPWVIPDDIKIRLRELYPEYAGRLMSWYRVDINSYDEYFTANLFSLMRLHINDTFESESWGNWLVSKGVYAGTLPKRLSSMMYKVYGIRLTSQLLSILGGELGKINKAVSGGNYITVLDGIDWESGAFGDEGSCFWGDRSGAKYMLSESGALSFKVYSTYQPDNGHSQECHCDYEDIQDITVSGNNTVYSNSRCWIIPHHRGLIMFNGYGYELIKQVRMLSTLLGVSYTKISLDNHGRTSDTMYINSGVGYLLGNQQDICNTDYIDLNIQDYDNSECAYCGDSYSDDELTCINGENYCEDCLSEHFRYCECCNEYKDSDYAYWIDSRGEYVCEYHYNRRDGYDCEECGRYYLGNDSPSVDIYYDNDSGIKCTICESCAKDNYIYCDNCDTWHESECESCMHENESVNDPEYSGGILSLNLDSGGVI